jgi:hypothetical protein
MRRNFNWYKEKPLIHPKLGELETTRETIHTGYWVLCPACKQEKRARSLCLHIAQQARKGDKIHQVFLKKHTKEITKRVWK